MKKIKENNICTYYDENDNRKMVMVYDQGKITQLRFYLEDEDPSIKNKVLYLDTTRFKKGYTNSYEKHSVENGIEKIEHYEEDELFNYSLTEKTKEYKIKSIFYKNNDLLFKTKITYNKKGVPCKIENWDYDFGETKYYCYIIPVFPGYEDASKMTEEDQSELDELIYIYLHNPFINVDTTNSLAW